MSAVRRVKLLRDYTKVHPELKVGVIGELGRNVGFDSNYSVYFPEAGKYLNLFDTHFEYLLTPEEQLIYDQKIASAYDVIHETGPQGGYKYVSFKYKQPEEGIEIISFKRDGDKILELFKQQGTPIKVVVLPRKK